MARVTLTIQLSFPWSVDQALDTYLAAWREHDRLAGLVGVAGFKSPHWPAFSRASDVLNIARQIYSTVALGDPRVRLV